MKKRCSQLPMFWTLGEDGRTPTATSDVIAWADWMVKEEARRVALDVDASKQVAVSTVFLGLYPTVFTLMGEPKLFQTMIFGGPHNDYVKHYCTWAEAEEGHKYLVEMAGVNCEPPPAELTMFLLDSD